MKLLFPYNERENTGTFRIKDMLIPDQRYEFYGHIVDMSKYRDINERIPEKPSIEVMRMTAALTVVDIDGKMHVPGYDFYFCRAVEFNKVPQIETTHRNNAIMAFLKALDPEQFVVIKMSW